jgi:hypothetical protein
MNYKSLGRILKEDEKSVQAVFGLSLVHWHHWRPMIVVRNMLENNSTSFYVCSKENCNYKEIPYLAKIFNHRREYIYQNFDKVIKNSLF